MRAQQAPIRKIKGIVHGARRMILRDIQRFEIMKVILDFGSRDHLESGLGKDALDPQARARHRMHAARLLTAARQRHIDGALGKLPRHRRLLEADPMHLERGLDRRLRIVDALARGRTLGGGRAPPTP